jgi:hypothetical protein
MKIISLSSHNAGYACAVACIIKQKYYNNNCNTNFCDYLEISFKSIVQLLSLENLSINNKLSSKNIISNKDSKNTVLFDNFDKIYSHHDLIQNYSENDFNDLIKKYERRYNRLINDIKTEDKIFFIRYGIENEDLIINFFKIIESINPNLKMYFINTYFDEDINKSYYSDNLTKSYNFYHINFKNFSLGPYYNNKIDLFEKTFEYNWDKIFEIIKSINEKI